MLNNYQKLKLGSNSLLFCLFIYENDGKILLEKIMIG